jgi:hypothetical protein
MKNLTFILIFLMFAAVSVAQPKLQLSESEHNFGVFKEEAGPQKFTFEVTNTGNQPLVITTIVPSCGCTTPDWTKSPIPPNGKGAITATYDPANRPGPFDKTMAVHTNAVPEMVVLRILGEVKPHEKTVEEIYTFPVGGVRFESTHMAFTTITKNERKIRVMPIINTSAEPVKVEFDGVPAHLELKVNPETLKPGQKGLVEGTYDGTKNPGWGTLTDMVRVKLNGVVQPTGYYVLSATLVEDFSTLTKEELANAPVFKVAATTVDIGPMDPSTTRDVEFKYTNDGKRDLIIRYVRASCGCTAILQGANIVKPGESGIIKGSFNSGTYPPGPLAKAIYVYTNDPKNSEVVLYLNATINKKEPEKK